MAIGWRRRTVIAAASVLLLGTLLWIASPGVKWQGSDWMQAELQPLAQRESESQPRAVLEGLQAFLNFEQQVQADLLTLRSKVIAAAQDCLQGSAESTGCPSLNAHIEKYYDYFASRAEADGRNSHLSVPVAPPAENVAWVAQPTVGDKATPNHEQYRRQDQGRAVEAQRSTTHRLRHQQQQHNEAVATLASTKAAPTPFVWLRTHLTRNSIFMNILNRAVFTYGLNSIIPSSGSFVGWPYTDAIKSNFRPRFPWKETLDAFCCGTFAYNATTIQHLVPENAVTLSVLRDPVDEFISLWQKFQFSTLIQQDTGKFVTMEQYLRSPAQYLSALTHSHSCLFDDIIATDFGLNARATADDVDRVISTLQSGNSLVLMSDFLFESLVLLKNRIGLTMEDMAFIYNELPVPEQPDQSFDDQRTETVERLIRAVNWKGVRIFNAFNATFHELLSKQPPPFFDEVRRLRELVQKTTEECRGHSYPALSLMQQIAKNPASAREIPNRCALMRGNDMQFIQLYADDASELTTRLESTFRCTARPPETKLVWLKTHKTGSSTITNMFHRFGYRHNLSLALPKDDMYYGWPAKRIRESIVYPDDADPETYKFDMLCSAHSVMDRNVTDRLIERPKYVTLLRDPLAHFISAWNYWGIGRAMSKDPTQPLDYAVFLQDPPKYMQSAPVLTQALIHNSIAYDLGFNFTATNPTEADIQLAIKTLSSPTTGIDMVLITEYMDESLIVMRHKFCWDLSDLVTFSLKVTKSGSARSKLPADQQRQILEFNALDAALYAHFNRTLWEEIAKIPTMQEEVEALSTLRSIEMQKCAEAAYIADRIKAHSLYYEPRNSPKAQCAALTIDSVEFSRHFKRISGVMKHDCLAPLPQRMVAVAKPQYSGPLGHVLMTILYRRAYRRRWSVLFPKKPAQEDLGEDLNTQLFPPSKEFVLRARDASTVYTQLLGEGGDQFYSQQVLGQIFANANQAQYLVWLPDPVEAFVQAWDQLQLSATFQIDSLDSIAAVLRDPAGNNHPRLEALRDRMSKMFSDALEGETLTPIHIQQKLSEQYSITPFAVDFNNLDAVIVYLSRTLCWDLPDMTYYIRQRSRKSYRETLSPDTIRAIESFHSTDMAVFQSFNTSFFTRISREIGFQDDLDRFRALQADLQRKCASLEKESQRTLIKYLRHNPDPIKRECSMLLLDSAGIESWFLTEYNFEKPVKLVRK